MKISLKNGIEKTCDIVYIYFKKSKKICDIFVRFKVKW